MSDDPDKPESGAGEAKPEKTKAEDNPWYLLATLYGVPGLKNPELFEKNRRVWNRYFAVNLDEAMRARLIAERGYPDDELPRSLTMEERQKITDAFASRALPRGEALKFPVQEAKSTS